MDICINIEECVNENTIKFGIGELEGIGSLTVQKQLVKIEEFLQDFCMNQKRLSEQLKQFSKLSISSVSAGAKVPRSQINLNTNTLKFYIENRIMEIEKKDIFNIKKHERLKSEKRELETHLDGLRQQIVDSFELKLRLEMLESENKRLILQMESRQKDVQKLEEENSKLRKALNERNKKKIVPFN
ncbi:hypothetical protein BK709_27315 [Bacillus thuringiensis serovar shandongiensis]|uniref:hypothetical protein n=1 Tax=Bacillus TaxID=1386 RepID=UPI000B44E805|nr:hypothetical protein [Bacillus cereus]OTX25922.1 hypothetical protein BK717_32040 [Bacillus thuringiensis serovar malayensis]OUB02414.1 hypothetical protein BK709_27315 [Bacillus thuringiensis serovar shandongiensis]WHT91878.1 hypothetical protein QM226_002138 [Bacillus cereus]HEF1904225.1 hypothetical protein [Bacillus cereus]